MQKHHQKGWNSWDVYGASVTGRRSKRNADIMAEKFKKYGWNHRGCRYSRVGEPGAESAAYRKFGDLKIDEYSRVLPAENRFPSSADGVGFAPLAEYAIRVEIRYSHFKGNQDRLFMEECISKERIRQQIRLLLTAFVHGIQICMEWICQFRKDSYIRILLWNCMLHGELISLR